MHALWGMGQMALTKTLVIVDEEVNVQDLGEVIWRVGNHLAPERDLVVVKGPVDELDHAAPVIGFGSKLGIDATRKWPEEGHTRPWPEEIRMSEDVKERVAKLWQELGL
jgi:4-hydroxy-3-polyprenylbenzoate decarboxylase